MTALTATTVSMPATKIQGIHRLLRAAGETEDTSAMILPRRSHEDGAVRRGFSGPTLADRERDRRGIAVHGGARCGDVDAERGDGIGFRRKLDAALVGR